MLLLRNNCTAFTQSRHSQPLTAQEFCDQRVLASGNYTLRQLNFRRIFYNLQGKLLTYYFLVLMLILN